MRSSTKKGLCIGSVAVFSLVTAGYYLKGLINGRIEESITQYEQKDKKWTRENLEEGLKEYEKQGKKWTEEKFREMLRGYEQADKQWTEEKFRELLGGYEQADKQWTRENFEARVPLEQLLRAFNSTYQVVNESYYETREGKIIKGSRGSGSSILLKGGYLLTAKHVVDEDFPREFSEYYWGLVKYHHNKLSILDKDVELEKILMGRDKNLDYALLKLKDSKDLSFYNHGLNMPSIVVPGMRSAAIGFSLGIKNIRLGNVSQIESDAGENYFTFKNSIIFGDSGGPLFVIENGDIKLVGISSMLIVMRDSNVPKVSHPTNIGYGLKIETILENMQEKLKSGDLDEETAKELENFLRLNK